MKNCDNNYNNHNNDNYEQTSKTQNFQYPEHSGLSPRESLQFALIKAAKVGHVELMREFIELGADPLALDENNCSAIGYVIDNNPVDKGNLFAELAEIVRNFKARGKNV